MSLKLATLVVQAALIAAHTNDGCFMQENMTFTGEFFDYVQNISTVNQCASLCRKEANCSYWTLLKDNGYCDLWDTIAGNRTESLAISGSKACGDETIQPTTTTTTTTNNETTTTNSTTESIASELCWKTLNIFNEECIENETAINGINYRDVKEGKHCQATLNYLKEYCGFEYQISMPNSTIKTPSSSSSELCENMLKASEDCGFGQDITLSDEDRNHCQGIQEHLTEYCGFSEQPCTTTTTTTATTTATTTITTTTTTMATTMATTTTLSELCQNMMKAAESCGFNSGLKVVEDEDGNLMIVEDEDGEHCQGILGHLKEYCGQ